MSYNDHSISIHCRIRPSLPHELFSLAPKLGSPKESTNHQNIVHFSRKPSSNPKD